MSEKAKPICSVCGAVKRWEDCPECEGRGFLYAEIGECGCWRCNGEGGAWECPNYLKVDYPKHYEAGEGGMTS